MLKAAEANPAWKAHKTWFTQDRVRREALIGRKIVTEAALDQARYAVEGLKASIAAGVALLESQKTQLDYLTIRAPITGRTGSLSAKIGAMVRGVDAAAAVLSIHSGKIPPAINTKKIIGGEKLNVSNQMRDTSGKVAISSVYSLGGQNAALVFRKV